MITSVKNRRIVEAYKLYQRKHRERQHRFLVEGLDIIEAAINSGALPDEIFYCSGMLRKRTYTGLVRRLQKMGVTLVDVSPQVLEHLSRKETPTGLLATFGLFETPIEYLQAIPIHKPTFLLILDRLQDPGNVGTLIRTADAVGAYAVVLIEPCVDPFDYKTVAGTTGSLFSVPVIRTYNLPDLFSTLASRITVVGSKTLAGKVAWNSTSFNDSVALVLGNEARGISQDMQVYIDEWVHLPLIGNAESLNVSVAGGALAYIWLTKNL